MVINYLTLPLASKQFTVKSERLKLIKEFDNHLNNAVTQRALLQLAIEKKYE